MTYNSIVNTFNDPPPVDKVHAPPLRSNPGYATVLNIDLIHNGHSTTHVS